MEALKEAVAAAEQYLRVLMPEAQDLQVEEVESGMSLTDADVYVPWWTITLSFKRSKVEDSLAMLRPPRRVYKEFHVVDGEVLSMKIRELSGA